MTPLQSDLASRALVAGLITQHQVEMCQSRLGPQADEREVCEFLVGQGLLTKWQATQLQAGKTQNFFLGHYLLLDSLGAGGMGQVFRAFDTELSRHVAVKVLPGRAATPKAIERFRREADAALQMRHEHMVETYELGLQGSTHYLVMELVDGATLKKYISRRGRLSVRATARIGHEVALALQHALERGIVHRDIKPSNILLTRQGKVKLADLGLAKIFGASDDLNSDITRTGRMMGTIDYCAPEQAENAKRADTRSDVYSLGCTLYHCLTGEPPFVHESAVQKILAHRIRPPASIVAANHDVQPQFAELIERRMMAKAPQERLQTPEEVAKALEPWAKGQVGEAMPWEGLGGLLAETDLNSASQLTGAGRSATLRTGDWQSYGKGKKWFQRPGILASMAVAIVAAAIVIIQSASHTPGQATPPPDVSPVATAPEGGERKAFEPPPAPRSDADTPESTAVAAQDGPTETSPLFASLFNGRDLDGWVILRSSPGGLISAYADNGDWRVESEALVCSGQAPGWLRTSRQFADFDLRLEFRLIPGAESGVLVRSSGTGDLVHSGILVQLAADEASMPRRPNQRTGALYGVVPPNLAAPLAVNAWHSLEIRCERSDVRVTIDGSPVVDVDTASFAPLADRPRLGYIALSNGQGRAARTSFRNVRLRELAPVTVPSAGETPPRREEVSVDSGAATTSKPPTAGNSPRPGRPSIPPRAKLGEDFTALFDSEGLHGLKFMGAKENLKVSPEILELGRGRLSSIQQFGRFEFALTLRMPAGVKGRFRLGRHYNMTIAESQIAIDGHSPRGQAKVTVPLAVDTWQSLVFEGTKEGLTIFVGPPGVERGSRYDVPLPEGSQSSALTLEVSEGAIQFSDLRISRDR